MNTQFIEFLARNNAIRFGDFTLKSGRQSPYFIDLGIINSGSTTAELGKHYASKINEAFGSGYDVIFGPAYKAIPISLGAILALNSIGINKKWLFDRKEKKVHGADANSVFVGSQALDAGQKVVIVDDVLTTGGTKVESMEKLEKVLGAEVVGIVIAVDRMERGIKFSALQEFSESTGVPVHAIENISNIFNHLKGRELEGKVYVTDKIFESYRGYMAKYGISV